MRYGGSLIWVGGYGNPPITPYFPKYGKKSAAVAVFVKKFRKKKLNELARSRTGDFRHVKATI